MMEHRTVAGVILAGGRNTRMGGVDKAFLKVGGKTVFERTFEVMHRCFDEVIVVTNSPEKYQRFPVTLVTDEFRGAGPLAGIHAALGSLRSAFAFVVACDMPFLRIEPIELLLGELGSSDAVIPWWDGDIEPLHALYARKLRRPIEEALAQGTNAIRDFLPRIRVRYVPESVMQSVVGAEEAFRNVNTPDDAARYAVELGRETIGLD